MVYQCVRCNGQFAESELKDDATDGRQQVCPVCDGDLFEILRDD